ncbi:hypothetical protein A3K69_03110 [Candidatus Bathyarchaeota archaeon RBG_16_57_9]|nr:MAG: hypothetical protein A3K69_03110 [Candidatus Bathyarchaeota archaeon RBG_16_57_9]
MDPRNLRRLLLFLTAEKVVQHLFVTYAFYIDLGGLRSQVAPDYRILMGAGFVVFVLFAVSLYGQLLNAAWAIGLVNGLAVFDVGGEFYAQGSLIIDVTVSFVVAVVILLTVHLIRREVRPLPR